MVRVKKCDQLGFVNLHLDNVHIMCIGLHKHRDDFECSNKDYMYYFKYSFFILYERLKKNRSA